MRSLHTTKSRRVCLIGALTTCVAIATPMFASADIKTNYVASDQVVVTYAVSDLNQPGGLEQLQRQIRKAAQEVCGAAQYSQTRLIQSFSRNRGCINAAVGKAMEGIGEMQLTSN